MKSHKYESKQEFKNNPLLPKKVFWQTKTIIIQVPYCPKCFKQISKVTDIDARTIMTWHCDNCNYSE